MSEYWLEDQIGFLLRKANQRHRVLFSEMMDPPIAPAQFAILVKLAEQGATSQNELGRMVAMDAATTKGVIDRLADQGLVETRKHPDDGRRLLVEITEPGTNLLGKTLAHAVQITEATLEPLTTAQRATLLDLLHRIT